jgi:outer membrane protein assembly factor BamC
MYKPMKNLYAWMIGCGILSALTGCSYLEDYFPDKEKDYQYTSEIPLLNWPENLRKNNPPPNSDSNATSDATASSLSDNPMASADSDTVTEGGASAPDSSAAAAPVEIKSGEGEERNEISSVEIIKYDDGESRLRLGAGASKAWRAVSKALSHNTIEVTSRNHDQGLITLQYDPDEKPAKDESFLDEIAFFFHGVDTNEQEYQLKLEEHGETTDVLVLNSEHLPVLNSEAALRLLQTIAGTIKADSAEQKTE